VTPTETLVAVCRAGGTLEVRGDRLALRADAPLPQDLVAAVRLHRQSLLKMLTRWNSKLADAWIEISVERVSKLQDELAPDYSADDADWDKAEALVDAAYLAKSRQGLRDALDAYEQQAQRSFITWSNGGGLGDC
jgi:hypothetical protein